MKLSGWGNYPRIEAKCFSPRDIPELRGIISQNTNVIARGNGRSYGDPAINPNATIQMQNFNKMLSFNQVTGELVAEAGVLLVDIISAFLTRGWFPAVTPGTKFVTLGGMIAADIHGKNHHKEGSFRECVEWIELINADGQVCRCSRSSNFDLFDFTLGGMGLTGVIYRASIRLRPVETAWIRQKTIPASNIREAIEIFEDTQDYTYSVAWIDCLSSGINLGRSLVMLGEHAKLSDLSAEKAISPLRTPNKREFSLPFSSPIQLLNSYTVGRFNEFYYYLGSCGVVEQLVGWDSYFYPLDAILGWNKIYGRKGFIQFQCVLPLDHAREGLSKLLHATSSARSGSFLAVLKRLGQQNSKFSFPTAGYTLALDFPVSNHTFSLVNELTSITIAYGGRFYLAKDCILSSEALREADSRVIDFCNARNFHGWSQHFTSSQSERLSL